MFDTKSLKEELGQTVNELNELADTIEREQRNFNDEELARCDELDNKKTDLEKKIATAERLQKVKGISAPAVVRSVKTSTKIDKRDVDNAFRAFMLNNPASDHLIRSEWKDAADKLGVNINSDRFIVRTDLGQDLGTTGQGPELIDGSIFQQLVKKLKAYQGIRQVATSINTANGNPLHWAVNDDTANEAEIVGENTAQASLPMTFTTVTVGSFTYRSNIFPVSYELLQDAQLDVTAVISDALATRIGRRLNKDFTVGVGTTQPKGLVPSCTVGVTTAAATAITYGELLDLYHSVDPEYRDNACWMMHDSTFAYLEKTLVDGNDRPMFLGTDFGNVAAGSPRTLFGKPIVVNNQMPEIAATKKVITFGDHSRYVIRDVAAPSITVLRERFADQAAIGVMAFARADGVMLNADACKVLALHAAG